MRITVVGQDHLLKDLLIHALESKSCEVAGVDCSEDATLRPDHDLFIVDSSDPHAVSFLKTLTSQSFKALGLVDSEDQRNILRAEGIPYVDKREGLASLLQAIRHAVGVIIGPSSTVARILVVDDDEDVRGLLVQSLTKDGYAIYTAPNGRKALEAIKSDSEIAAVLLDIMMPELGGLDTLAEIVKHKRHPEVLMLSSMGDQEIAQHAVKLGAFAYLTKPPDLREVHSTVSACVGRFERRKR